MYNIWMNKFAMAVASAFAIAVSTPGPPWGPGPPAEGPGGEGRLLREGLGGDKTWEEGKEEWKTKPQHTKHK